jgi:hypothetical protein
MSSLLGTIGRDGRAISFEFLALQSADGCATSNAMPTEPKPPASPAPNSAERAAAERRPLRPAAERALAEAAARRAERDGHSAQQPTEVAARGGPDPTRYGDWEINGLASDF